MIGRIVEQQVLDQCLESDRAEFLVVYGRRRVGKTFLIREYFRERFSFYSTGVAGFKNREQLKAFHASLQGQGCQEKRIPKDWFEAFSRLRALLERPEVLRHPTSRKRVVFLDELPWMDAARADFKPALDYFWNSWASTQKDLLLIVCGSATSWIIENLLADVGGFYNRITRQLHLSPFTLEECEALLKENRFVFTRRQIVECYMVFGGIPYYLNCLDRSISLAQNIEKLCFQETGQLHYEYDRLFSSLFRNPGKHLAIIEALAGKRGGMTRAELSVLPGIGNGESLTKALLELEQCGFIRKYTNFVTRKQGHYFQLIDPFTLFHLRFLRNQEITSWLTWYGTPGYYSWCGNAFELVCLHHVPQMKVALGIFGIESSEYAWRSQQRESGTQVDLLIDRRDGIINICEMKFTESPFALDAAYEQHLRHRIDVFRQETGTKKAVHLTMVSASGLVNNAYADVAQQVLDENDLFRPLLLPTFSRALQQ